MTCKCCGKDWSCTMLMNTILWRLFKITNCKVCGKHYRLGNPAMQIHKKLHKEYDEK